jgi:hypothetical protein
MKKEAAASFKIYVNHPIGLYGVMTQNIKICVCKWLIFIKYLKSIHYDVGYAVAQLVEALHYKPEGHGFDFQWCRWNFSLT